jgi:hypothetical protein
MWQVERFAAPGWPTGAGNTSRYFRWRTCPRVFSLPLAHRVPYVLIAAGVGMIVSHAMPGGDRHNCALRLLAFPLFSPLANTGGSRKRRDSFHDVSSPSEWITRAKIICPLSTTSLYSSMTCIHFVARLLHQGMLQGHEGRSRATPLEMAISLRIPWDDGQFGGLLVACRQRQAGNFSHLSSPSVEEAGSLPPNWTRGIL